jgi:hypothetical protein
MEALEITSSAARVDRDAVEIVLHDVAGGDELGSDGARHEIALGRSGVARADVSIAVEHALVDENPVGRDQILDESGIRGPRARQGLRLGCRRRAQCDGGRGEAEKEMAAGNAHGGLL